MTVFVKIDFNADDNTINPTPDDTPIHPQRKASRKMPKKKSKAAQTQPLISDYETDTYVPDHNAAPPVRQLSNAELNHVVLQRWCPDLQQILAIAPFAVLYNFNSDNGAWEKSDIQGSLFVLQLQDPYQPRYEVMILNRKHPENLHIPIVSSENIEVADEFVILHIEGDVNQTIGLWMFSDQETLAENRLEAIAAKIMECAMQTESMASNGQEHMGEEYGTDGVAESQYYEEQQPKPVRESIQGQSIDLATLFGKSVQQQQQSAPQPQAQQNMLLDLFKNANKG